MKRSRPPWPGGVGWALVLAGAMLSGPMTVRAQSTTESGKPTVEKKDDAAAKKAEAVAQKLAAEAQKQKMGPQPPKVVNRRPAKPVGSNQIPEPTVVLKPGEMPAIKFDMTTYDFGRIRAGGDVVHDFWFSNTGNGPLEILRVKPG